MAYSENITSRFSGVALRARPAIAILFGGICLFPFLYLILLSLGQEWGFPDILPEALSLDLWIRMITGNSALGNSFLLSFFISSIVATLSTFSGYATGKYTAYHPQKDVLLFLAYVPFVMSPVILGTCLMYIYIKAELTGSVLGVILAQTMFAYGFSIVFFSAFWNKEIKALEDLVYTLGGTPMQAYRRVLLPISKGMLLICFFQTF